MVLLLVTSALVSQQVVQLYLVAYENQSLHTHTYFALIFCLFCKEHGKETRLLLCIYQTLLVRTLHHVHVHVDITFTLHHSCKSLILKYFYEII